MKNLQTNSKNQSGVMLLEALIGILIFSLGILAVVGLQAASIKVAADSKYRSDASLLANNLIGQMWAGDRKASTLKANFQGGYDGADPGAGYLAWLNDVQNGPNRLPGVTDDSLPIVQITQVVGANANSSLVSITMKWKAPNEKEGVAPHQYQVILQVI